MQNLPLLEKIFLSKVDPDVVQQDIFVLDEKHHHIETPIKLTIHTT